MALTPYSDPQVGAGPRNWLDAVAVPRFVGLNGGQPTPIAAFGEAVLQQVMRSDADYRVLTFKVGAWVAEDGRLPPTAIGGMVSPLPVPVAQPPHPFQGGVGHQLQLFLTAEVYDAAQGISLGFLPIGTHQGLAGGATSMRRCRILARDGVYKIVVTNRSPFALQLQGVLFGYAILR